VLTLGNINKAIMDPSTQQIFFCASDVIAITCFGHTTIIKQYAAMVTRNCLISELSPNRYIHYTVA
jgi:hypothetical protein